jgi:ribosomal protein S27E
MGITEKAAYIKGLFEGYEIDAAKKEDKIISEMLTLIADMADEISALKADNRDLHEYVEELDHDLGELEEEIYFGDDYDEEEEYEDYDEEDSDYYEIECPSCGEIVCFDDSLEEDELVCPACGELVTGIEICDGDCSNCSADCDAE